MKDEYDFSDAERGKFHRDDSKIHMPLYLDGDVFAYLSKKAAAKGVPLNDLVNDMLKRDIGLMEGAES